MKYLLAISLVLVSVTAAASSIIVQPTRVKYVKPIYPKEALDQKIEGTVTLEVVINEKGNVKEVKVVRSIPLLDQAAVDAVQKWKFAPTKLYGMPIPVLATVSVEFKLPNRWRIGIAFAIIFLAMAHLEHRLQMRWR